MQTPSSAPNAASALKVRSNASGRTAGARAPIRLQLLLLCVTVLLVAAGPAAADPPVPAFYDDFSDGKWQNRTGTDPWGRAFPEWHPDEYVPNKPHVWTVVNGYIVATSAALGGEDRAYAASTTAYGEWNFRFRMPRNDVSIYVWFIFAKGPQGSYAIGFREDGHQYLLKRTPSGSTHLWKVCTTAG